MIFIRFCLGFLPVLRQAKLLFSRALRGRILAIVGKVTKSFLLDKPFCEIAPEKILLNLKITVEKFVIKAWLVNFKTHDVTLMPSFPFSFNFNLCYEFLPVRDTVCDKHDGLVAVGTCSVVRVVPAVRKK